MQLGLRTGAPGSLGLRLVWLTALRLVVVTAVLAVTTTVYLRGFSFGSFSSMFALVTVGIAHIFMPQWRVSPFVGIGGGVVQISPKSTLVQPEDRTDEAAYAGLGVRGFLTDRFLVQAEYRKFQVFTSRDENEEPDSWTVAFTYFF